MPADRRPSMRLPIGAGLVPAFALALAGCQPAKPPPAVPPPPVVPTIMPTPPDSAAPDMDLPEKDETGRYLTPNRNMTGQQALWHVRMALNVAALGCHGNGDPVRVQYNQMLHIHVLPLRLANDATENYYKARYGANAFDMREKTNTIVYNFFALPPAQKAFCQVAQAEVTILNGLTAAQLVDRAPTTLHNLEQPFQDFWDAYADYLRRLAEWRKRFGRPTVRVEEVDAPPPPPPRPRMDIGPEMQILPSTRPIAPSSTLPPASGTPVIPYDLPETPPPAPSSTLPPAQ